MYVNRATESYVKYMICARSGVSHQRYRDKVYLPVPSQNDVMKPLLFQFQQRQADIKENRKLGSWRAKSC